MAHFITISKCKSNLIHSRFKLLVAQEKHNKLLNNGFQFSRYIKHDLQIENELFVNKQNSFSCILIWLFEVMKHVL